MTHAEYLERQAARYINDHQPLPIDLVMKMSAEGMNVVAIEKQLEKEREANNG